MWPQIKYKRELMTSKQKEKYEEEKERLVKKYDSSFLTREEAAKELKMSKSSLDRLKKKGFGPIYQKQNYAKNSTVKYPICEFVEYMILFNLKTI